MQHREWNVAATGQSLQVHHAGHVRRDDCVRAAAREVSQPVASHFCGDIGLTNRERSPKPAAFVRTAPTTRRSSHERCRAVLAPCRMAIPAVHSGARARGHAARDSRYERQIVAHRQHRATRLARFRRRRAGMRRIPWCARRRVPRYCQGAMHGRERVLHSFLKERPCGRSRRTFAQTMRAPDHLFARNRRWMGVVRNTTAPEGTSTSTPSRSSTLHRRNSRLRVQLVYVAWCEQRDPSRVLWVVSLTRSPFGTMSCGSMRMTR